MGAEKLVKAAGASKAFTRFQKLEKLYELPEETAKRAKAAGYDTDIVLFHGTNRDIHEFKLDQTGTRNDPGFYGRGFYFSQSPKVAAEYATKWGSQPSGSNVLPVLIRGNFLDVDIEENGSMAYGLLKNKIRKQWGEDTFNKLEGAGPIQEFPDRVREFLMSEGFDGVKISDGPDGFLQEVVVFDNKNVKSVFAKFEDTESGNLAAGVGGSAVAAGAATQTEEAQAEGMSQEEVKLLLKGRGFSNKLVAGLMGAIDVETGGSFAHNQKQYKGGPGRGLFQIEEGNDLSKGYREYLMVNEEYDTAHTQIDFMLDTVYGEYQDIIGRGNAAKLRTLFEEGTAEEIVEGFTNIWLRPGKPHMERRKKATQEHLGALEGENDVVG